MMFRRKIAQAVTVTPFSEAGERYCLVEIRDVSGTAERERRLLDHAESLRARSYVDLRSCGVGSTSTMRSNLDSNLFRLIDVVSG